MDQVLLIAMTAVAVVLCMLIVVLFVKLAQAQKRIALLEQRYNRFLRGKDVKDMEQIILKRFAGMDALKKSTRLVADSLEQINEMGKLSLQKVGIVKYDAFDDMGGNLSFALALLNHQNSGIVINSVHAREGCYTYAKEVVNGESYIVLGAEEKEALEIAKNSNNYMQ